MPAGFTEEGYPYLGDPNASVKIIEYSDYLCPFSGRHYTQTMPTLLEEYVRTGKVMYVYRDFPIASLHPTASMGSVAAACVGEQGAAAFWTMHDELFNARDEWSGLQDPTGFLTDLADMIGTDMVFEMKLKSVLVFIVVIALLAFAAIADEKEFEIAFEVAHAKTYMKHRNLRKNHWDWEGSYHAQTIINNNHSHLCSSGHSD